MPEIIRLDEDFNYYLKNWKENTQATANQIKLWPQNKKIPHELLGNDAENCMRLLESDGFDGKPVGSVGKRMARAYFWDGENHKWPHIKDILRFGLFFHLGLYKTLALIIKRKWEDFFYYEMHLRGTRIKRDDIDDDSVWRSLKNTAEANQISRDNYKIFTDGESGELFKLFEAHNKFASNPGYDEEHFDILIRHMMEARMYLVGTNSNELERFIQEQEKEIAHLKQATKIEEETFWIKKCQWIEMKNEIGSQLLYLENQRLKNENIRQRWMATFGEIYIDYMEKNTLRIVFQMRLDLKEADPNLTIEEIKKIELEEDKNEFQKLRIMKMEIELMMIIGEPNGVPVYGQELIDYKKECADLLREIRKRTHSDAYNHYKFTKDQIKKLDEYYIEAGKIYEQFMKIHREEIGFDLRSVQIFQEIYDKVNELYKIMGLDIPDDTIIQGNTIQEQINWLENQIIGMEKEIETIKNEQYILTTDMDIKEKIASMASDELVEKTKMAMERKIDEIEKEIEILKKKLLEIFGEEGISC